MMLLADYSLGSEQCAVRADDWSLSDLRMDCGNPTAVAKGSVRVGRWTQAVLLWGERDVLSLAAQQ